MRSAAREGNQHALCKANVTIAFILLSLIGLELTTYMACVNSLPVYNVGDEGVAAMFHSGTCNDY